MFSGSYKQSDVRFLLKSINLPFSSLEEKELLIQNQNKHYSEMLSLEEIPNSEYMSIFYSAFERNKQKLALDLIKLAYIINTDKPQNTIVLTSLARAGTPIGVLLKFILELYFDRKTIHYSVSIIRDKGLDFNALKYIIFEKKYLPEQIVFIDGWTGKGIIANELNNSINNFNHLYNTQISSNLFVLADLCGYAHGAASNEDYLIPSSILNSTISGLISRSILNKDYINESIDFHGCVYYKDFEKYDLSNWFIDETLKCVNNLFNKNITAQINSQAEKNTLKQLSSDMKENIKKEFKITNINHIKPGIGEATRVLLRRIPDILIIKDKDCPDVQHLLLLAKQKKVAIITDINLPYKAVSLIKKVL